MEVRPDSMDVNAIAKSFSKICGASQLHYFV